MFTSALPTTSREHCWGVTEWWLLVRVAVTDSKPQHCWYCLVRQVSVSKMHLAASVMQFCPTCVQGFTRTILRMRTVENGYELFLIVISKKCSRVGKGIFPRGGGGSCCVEALHLLLHRPHAINIPPQPY